MAGIVLLLAFVPIALAVVYGLRRPYFWMAAGLVVLVALPVVATLLLLGVVH